MTCVNRINNNQRSNNLCSSSIDRDANLQSKNSPNNNEALSDKQIENIEKVVGLISTLSAATVTTINKHKQQSLIYTPLSNAIRKLEQTGDPVQIEKAQALRDANKINGLAGKIHANARDYNVESTLNSRNNALSKDSVIGGKLTRELAKASDKLDIAEKTIKRTGTIGMIAGPVIGSVAEIAKLDQNATASEKVTAGIVGVLKNVDNLAVGALGGTAGTILGAPTGPGAVATGTAGAILADEGYKSIGLDKSFNELIDKASPTIQSAVEIGLNTTETILDASFDALTYAASTAESALKAGEETAKNVKNYTNDVADNISDSVEYLYHQIFDENTASE